jgi:hypothetical protein
VLGAVQKAPKNPFTAPAGMPAVSTGRRKQKQVYRHRTGKPVVFYWLQNFEFSLDVCVCGKRTESENVKVKSEKVKK